MEQELTGAAQVLRSYLESFSSGDPDRIAGHVAEGFVNEHVAALGEGCTGRDAYRERLPGFLAGFEDLRYEVEDVVADGGRAVATYRMTARWEGRPVDIRGAVRVEVQAGLITRRTDYWDSLTFLRQTGQA